MSSGIEYLGVLEGALESGGLVVSIPVKDADDADDLVDLLGARAGHSFAYFSNWEFQPVRGHLEDGARDIGIIPSHKNCIDTPAVDFASESSEGDLQATTTPPVPRAPDPL